MMVNKILENVICFRCEGFQINEIIQKLSGIGFRLNPSKGRYEHNGYAFYYHHHANLFVLIGKGSDLERMTKMMMVILRQQMPTIRLEFLGTINMISYANGYLNKIYEDEEIKHMISKYL